MVKSLTGRDALILSLLYLLGIPNPVISLLDGTDVWDAPHSTITGHRGDLKIPPEDEC